MPIANHPHYTTMIGFASKEPSGVARSSNVSPFRAQKGVSCLVPPHFLRGRCVACASLVPLLAQFNFSFYTQNRKQVRESAMATVNKKCPTCGKTVYFAVSLRLSFIVSHFNLILLIVRKEYPPLETIITSYASNVPNAGLGWNLASSLSMMETSTATLATPP